MSSENAAAARSFRKRFASKRQLRLVKKRVAAELSQILETRPPFMVTEKVSVGREVSGWRSVDWGGANQVGSFCVIDSTVRVGFGSRIGSSSLLAGPLNIGRYVSIGAHVGLLATAAHPKNTAALYTSPTLYEGRRRDLVTHEAMTIGNDVWIGHGATLLGSIQVGDGAIVGAGSVVLEDVPPFAVVLGSPARFHRSRFDQSVCELLTRLAWWEMTPDELAPFEKLLSMDLTSDIQRARDSILDAISLRQELGLYK